MTQEELNRIVYQVIMETLPTARADANIPYDTGNLVRSIKVRQTEYGYDVYVDMNQAPYANDVNNGYWRRLAFIIHDRIRARLGGDLNTNYTPR